MTVERMSFRGRAASALLAVVAAASALLLAPPPAVASSTSTFSLTATGPSSTALIITPGAGPVTAKFALANLTGRAITVQLGVITAIKQPVGSTVPFTFRTATGFAAEIQLSNPVITLPPHRTDLVPVMVDRPRRNRIPAYAVITAEQLSVTPLPTASQSKLQLFVVLKSDDPVAQSTSDNAPAPLIAVASALIALELLALVAVLVVRRRRRRRLAALGLGTR